MTALEDTSPELPGRLAAGEVAPRMMVVFPIEVVCQGVVALPVALAQGSLICPWLATQRGGQHGMEAQAKPYQMLSPDPDQYPGSIIDKDLAQGKIDAAIVWGPIGSYYAKRVTNVALTVIPLKSEPGVKFDYEIAMGVRYGEPEWKATVEKLIAENQAAITAILREYSVPLVNERGEPIE